MGQAKLKRRAHAEILAGDPGCIYCAGANVAVTIEHIPLCVPKTLFELMT
jgi:hypothetical protein